MHQHNGNTLRSTFDHVFHLWHGQYAVRFEPENFWGTDTIGMYLVSLWYEPEELDVELDETIEFGQSIVSRVAMPRTWKLSCTA